MRRMANIFLELCVLALESENLMKLKTPFTLLNNKHFCSVTIQMKAIEQFFPVVLFIMLYKVVLTFESVDEILKCDHSNESN